MLVSGQLNEVQRPVMHFLSCAASVVSGLAGGVLMRIAHRAAYAGSELLWDAGWLRIWLRGFRTLSDSTICCSHLSSHVMKIPSSEHFVLADSELTPKPARC